MKNSPPNSDTAVESHYEISAFTRELISEVSRGHFKMEAWRILLARSWDRSLDDIRRSPARTRSAWSWIAAIAGMGGGIILLTLLFQTPGRALTALMFWLPWYAGAGFFLLTHLGMVDDSRGHPHPGLLLPNGLSFLRLGLAPLIVWPCLQIPVNPVTGPVFVIFLAGLSLSDLLDGWFARRRQLCTRLGRMLDPLADLALLTFLTAGLFLAGAIPVPLVILLLVRYPVLLIGVLIICFVRGPAPLRPTFIGKVTTFVTSIVLLAIAFQTLLSAWWPIPLTIKWSIEFLYLLLGVNISYLIYRAVTWAEPGKHDRSNT